MPVDESEIFQNAQIAQSIGVSMRTILSNLPWIKDVDEELDNISQEEEDARRKQEAEVAAMSGLNFQLPLPEGDEG
jgi:hypothetical protein